MKYKLMAVDIDGTLLNNDGVLTDKTIDTIKKAVEKGLVFTISTGRPIQGLEKINKELNLDVPFITYNGAMIIMSKTKNVLFEQRLSSNATKSIIDLGRKLKTSIMVWSLNKLYVEEINEKSEKYTAISGVEAILSKDFDIAIKNGATKILWHDDVETIEKFQSEIGQYLDDSIVFHTSRPYFLEFVDKKVSKAKAMEKIGECYGIDRSEMIAVGDGFNDISMIEYAGLGVVMGNAPEEVKKVGDYVTLSNDEDGVAYAIEKFFLKPQE